MTRTVLGSLVFVLLTGVASAAEIKSGVVSKIDTEKNTITVTIDGKDQTIKIAKDAPVTQLAEQSSGRRGRTTTLVEVRIADGLNSIKTNQSITLTIDTKDEKSIVSSIRLDDQQQQQSTTRGRRRR